MQESTLDNLITYLNEECGGIENSIKGSMLAGMFNTTGARIRYGINQLRCAGYPICSGHAGYYIAKHPEDIKHTIANLTSRMNSMTMAVNGLMECMYAGGKKENVDIIKESLFEIV